MLRKNTLPFESELIDFEIIALLFAKSNRHSKRIRVLKCNFSLDAIIKLRSSTVDVNMLGNFKRYSRQKAEQVVLISHLRKI